MVPRSFRRREGGVHFLSHPAAEFQGAGGAKMKMVVRITRAGIVRAMVKIVGRDDKRAAGGERAARILGSVRQVSHIL